MTLPALDLIIQIPLEEEFKCFLEFFAPTENISSELNAAYLVDAPNAIKMAVVLQEQMGRSSALHACTWILEQYSTKLYVCLGIAGGISKDLVLGDVCYTGDLIDVYDNSKVVDNKSGGGIDLQLDPSFYFTDRRITAALGFVRTMPELLPDYENWQTARRAVVDKLALGEVIGREGLPETIQTPKSLNGDVVCGAVVQSNAYKERLRGITRNPLAVETESGTVFDFCKNKGIHASYEVDLEGIEARIIADDEFKKNLDISDDDEYERVVSLLVDFLEYVGVAGPIDIVINQLLDHAKSAIIRNSLTKAEAETALGEVIKGLWLLDIGATGGNDAFGNAMKNMPPAMFLRAVITQILVFRARWKHPKKNTRYALLDAAEVLVRPLNPHLDKGELRRLIDRTPLDP